MNIKGTAGKCAAIFRQFLYAQFSDKLNIESWLQKIYEFWHASNAGLNA